MLHGTGDFNMCVYIMYIYIYRVKCICIYIYICSVYIYTPDFCYLEHTVAGCRQIQAAAERFGVKGLEDIQAA